MKRFIAVALMCFTCSVIADNSSNDNNAVTQTSANALSSISPGKDHPKLSSVPPVTAAKKADIVTADSIFNDLNEILCRQIVDMSSINKKDDNKGKYVKYSIADYLETIPKDKRENLRTIVLKQIDAMDKAGISHDDKEKAFVESHPVDLSMLMIMFFNNQALREKGLDQNLYDKNTVNILKEILLQIKALQQE